MVFVVKAGSVTLSANGTGTISIDVSAGKRFVIDKITFNSTGTFSITEIKDTATGQYYNVGTVKSGVLKNKANVNLIEVVPPIELVGSTSLVFNITDTSGSSNTVDIACWGNEE